MTNNIFDETMAVCVNDTLECSEILNQYDVSTEDIMTIISMIEHPYRMLAELNRLYQSKERPEKSVRRKNISAEKRAMFRLV